MIASEKNERIAFLFGAGVSIPAGMPSSGEILDYLLNGEVCDIYDGNYRITAPFSFPERVQLIKEFLKIVWDEIKNVVGEKANYEYLYYAIDKVYGFMLGDIDPLVKGFVNCIEYRSQTIIDEADFGWNLLDLLREAGNYIVDVVGCLLAKGPSCLDQFGILKEAQKSNTNSIIDIFTLNHDMNIEKYLESQKVPLVDGFEEHSGPSGFRFWTPELFDSTNNHINLFKLHGSLKWLRCRRSNESTHRSERIGIYEKNGDGSWGNPSDHSRILIGTANKPTQYTFGIFAELFGMFISRLNITEKLVISGYSFGDFGINMRIIEWLYKSETNSAVVIHPDEDGLYEGMRGEIRDKWCGFIREKAIKVIPKWIEETTWDEIAEYFV